MHFLIRAMSLNLEGYSLQTEYEFVHYLIRFMVSLNRLISLRIPPILKLLAASPNSSPYDDIILHLS